MEKSRQTEIKSALQISTALSNMKTGLEDGVHPNETGYACMGKYWSEQLLSYLNQTPIEPTPGSTTATVTTTTTETTTSVTASSETETTTAESTSITETETSETVSDTTETTTISSSESSTETATSQQPQPIKGDVTLDGTVNVADVVRFAAIWCMVKAFRKLPMNVQMSPRTAL